MSEIGDVDLYNKNQSDLDKTLNQGNGDGSNKQAGSWNPVITVDANTLII